VAPKPTLMLDAFGHQRSVAKGNFQANPSQVACACPNDVTLLNCSAALLTDCCRHLHDRSSRFRLERPPELASNGTHGMCVIAPTRRRATRTMSDGMEQSRESDTLVCRGSSK